MGLLKALTSPEAKDLGLLSGVFFLNSFDRRITI